MTPTVECPRCHNRVAFDADWCRHCETTISGSEMRAAWEAEIHGGPPRR